MRWSTASPSRPSPCSPPLPAPRRAPAGIVAGFLGQHFPDDVRRLSNPSSAIVIDAAITAGVLGGAVYDLVVGLVAAQAGATLVSLDRRALPAYEAADVAFELLT